jgi:HD-GYP domain-containing protein (c-di-GMP phosphodiesterase class II)
MKQASSSPVRSELKNIRIRLSDRFLMAAVVLAPLALAVGFYRAVATQWDPALVLYTGFVLALCLMAWRRHHLHHMLKGGVLLVVLLTVGVTGAVQNGLLAPALMYLVVAPPFANMLFGRRVAMLTLGLVVAALVAVGTYIVVTGHLPPVNILAYMTSPIAWVQELAVLILVIVLLQVAVDVFIGSLVKSLSTTHRRERHLIARNAMLERSTLALQQAHEATQASLEKNAAMVVRLDQVIRQTVDAFTTATVHTDPYTAGHEKRVADLSLTLGRRLGLSEDQLLGLELAAKVHDVGQLKVPSEILLRPNALTALEFKFVQQHSQAGWEILHEIDFPWPVAEIVRQHHENFDGSGYPSGLRGDAILLEARIIRVADLVEALSSHRPFRAARTREEVVQCVMSERGRAFDPVIADMCLEVLSEGYVLPFAAASAPPK